MTGNVPWFVFKLGETLFAIEARWVVEVVWLPTLTAVEELPDWVVGLFSLRGSIVPVADLSLRFGHAPRRRLLTDQVVVVDFQGTRFGLIVSESLEVKTIDQAAMQKPVQLGVAEPTRAALVAGEVQVDADIIGLLDLGRVLHEPELLQKVQQNADSVASAASGPNAGFAQITEDERRLFHQRTVKLGLAVVDATSDQLGLVVLTLGSECFCVELAAVREFCKVAQLRAIPCCPPHVLGAINLRGNLITLIDVRSALSLPAAQTFNGKALIADIGGHRVGMAVDEVQDVFYAAPEALQAATTGLEERNGSDIKGTVLWSERWVAVLDLAALLGRAEWIVGDNVS